MVTIYSFVFAQTFTLFQATGGKVIFQDDHAYIGSRDSVLHYIPTTFTQPHDPSFVFLNDISFKNGKSFNTIQDVFYQRGPGKPWYLIKQQPGALSTGGGYMVIVDVVRKEKGMIELLLQDSKKKKSKMLMKLPF
jgi:hypothetical protein